MGIGKGSSDHLPFRVPVRGGLRGDTVRWFAAFVLRAAVTDGLLALMAPACWGCDGEVRVG